MQVEERGLFTAPSPFAVCLPLCSRHAPHLSLFPVSVKYSDERDSRIMSSKGKIARAAGLMSIATLISRILGYVKDMILASYFGASAKSDVFFVAFRIPNLLRELFAEGSMSAAFVPVLTETQVKEGPAAANRLVRVVFIFLLAVVGLLCILGIIFAPAIVTVIAPGFVGDQVKFDDAVLLTRIMFPFLLFISLASLVMGALNTRGVFFVPALAPALLNVVTIIAVVFFASSFTNPIISVAIGIVSGGLVQMLFQVPDFWKQGYAFFRKNRDERGGKLGVREIWNHPGLRRIGILIAPVTMGMAVHQINTFVGTILASFLATGSITYLYFSMRLIQFPVGIFGVAMSMAILPALAEHAAKKEFATLKDDFSFALRLLFFITVPAMVGLIALRLPIVSALFGHGEYSPEAILCTADALMYYSLGIWAIVGSRVLTSTFYSMQDTKTPLRITVFSVAANIIFSLLLMGPMLHNGLALANSIAAAIGFFLLFHFLRRKLYGVGTGRIVKSFAKTGMASALMGICGWIMADSPLWTTGGPVAQKAGMLTALVAVSAAIYFAAVWLLGSEEMAYIVRKIRERIVKQ
jgi:putative peptidoglycan lipid II flippase